MSGLCYQNTLVKIYQMFISTFGYLIASYLYKHDAIDLTVMGSVLKTKDKGISVSFFHFLEMKRIYFLSVIN